MGMDEEEEGDEDEFSEGGNNDARLGTATPTGRRTVHQQTTTTALAAVREADDDHALMLPAPQFPKRPAPSADSDPIPPPQNQRPTTQGDPAAAEAPLDANAS